VTLDYYGATALLWWLAAVVYTLLVVGTVKVVSANSRDRRNETVWLFKREDRLSVVSERERQLEVAILELTRYVKDEFATEAAILRQRLISDERKAELLGDAT
jgi:hypothetical protein